MIDKATNFPMPYRHRPLIFIAVAMLLSILAQTGAAFAEDQRFYVGIAVPVEQLNASFDKKTGSLHLTTWALQSQRFWKPMKSACR